MNRLGQIYCVERKTGVIVGMNALEQLLQELNTPGRPVIIKNGSQLQINPAIAQGGKVQIGPLPVAAAAVPLAAAPLAAAPLAAAPLAAAPLAAPIPPSAGMVRVAAALQARQQQAAAAPQPVAAAATGAPPPPPQPVAVPATGAPPPPPQPVAAAATAAPQLLAAAPQPVAAAAAPQPVAAAAAPQPVAAVGAAGVGLLPQVPVPQPVAAAPQPVAAAPQPVAAAPQPAAEPQTDFNIRVAAYAALPVKEQNLQDKENNLIAQAEQIRNDAIQNMRELTAKHGVGSQVAKDALRNSERINREFLEYHDKILREREERVAKIQAAPKKTGWFWGGRKTGRKRRLTRHRRSRRR